MLTKKQLEAKREDKINQMKVLVEKRGASMDEETLATIKSMKEEIEQIDLNLDAIKEIRSIAVQSAKPPTKKHKDNKVEFRKTFIDYLRGKATNSQLEQRIMQAGAVGKGLETVPDEFYRILLDKILEYGMLFKDANVITTANHGDLLIPLADDTGNAGVWTAEGGTITPEDFATSNITMKAYKCTTAIVVSTELLEDAFFNIESYIASALGVRLARTFEDAFINGNGTGKPLGIVTDFKTKEVLSLVTLAVSAADMINAIYALTPALRIGAVFYVSDAQMKAMDSWVDTTGRPLLQPQASSTPSTPVTFTFKGYPVRINFELGSPTVVADVPVIFGNPKNYWVRNIRNINVKRSDELYMLTDEVVFTATTRLDGKPVNANPCFSKIVVIAGD